MHRRPTILFSLFLVVLPVSQAHPIPAGESVLPNVLLINVDTLRRDRVGLYGADNGAMPFVESLGATSFVFHRAYAQSSWTNPSVASLFTSRYPSQHSVISFGSLLQSQERTLAETLNEHGYRTAGFSGNFLIDRGHGFGQGFDTYQIVVRDSQKPNGQRDPLKGRAEELNRRALEWVDSLADDASPAFLYMHYMDPHAPYEPSAEDMQRKLGDAGPTLERINALMRYGGDEPSAEELAAALAIYDSEVAYTDASIRELVSALTERGFLDNAIIAFTADHGEEFYEHGMLGHHNSLYEAAIRVPLLIHDAGQTTRVDVHDLVETVDIAPTILSMAGVPSPPTFEGTVIPATPEGFVTRLWKAVTEAPQNVGRPRTAVSELLRFKGRELKTEHERVFLEGDDKVIASVDGSREYYDVLIDPAETDQSLVADEERELLNEGISQFATAVGGNFSSIDSPDIDAARRERMRALGYTE